MKEVYRAVRCPCGDPVCKDWHVSPVAQVQGVKFTEEQARSVVKLLSGKMIEHRAGREEGDFRHGDPGHPDNEMGM